MPIQLFHVLNRGVEGRPLFLDDSDHVRFVHDLYAFNDEAIALPHVRRKESNVGCPTPYIRKRLVEVHGWCLVKNHYHLILSELIEGGMSLFLKKINGGFANYFNARYERAGALFQGKTKRVLVESEAQFLYLLHYVHFNAFDVLGVRDWRIRDRGGIKDAARALHELETYRWSSYLDYIGKKNFPSILTTNLFDTAYGGYAASAEEFLKESEENAFAASCLE